MRGGFYVKVFQVKENVYYGDDRHVSVSWTNKHLNLKLVHFTSKMEPSSKESWKVEVSGEDAEMRSIEMLASMYDASLDAYASHYWPSPYLFYSDSNKIYNSFSNTSKKLNSWKNEFARSYKYIGHIKFPSFPSSVTTDYYDYGYDSCRDDDDEGPYSKYGGYNGWDDNTIDEAFDGNPELTWNID